MRDRAPRARGAASVAVPVLLVAALLAAGCAKQPEPPPPPPPPDADASPPQARPLALGAPWTDSLHRSANDLDDWYRLEIPGEGTLTLTLSASDPAGLPHLFVALTDERGVSRVQPTRAGGRAQVVVTEPVQRGMRLVWIGTDAEASGLIPYELRADLVPRKRPPPPPKRAPPAPPREVEPRTPPPPPAPRYETFTSAVVEIERPQGDAQFATIRGGREAGLAPGLRGRLIDGGRVIGRFTVVEVYAAGSRVRIDGGLSGSVSSRTVVEVDIPR